MRWSLPIISIPIVLVIVLLVGWGFYENKDLDFQKSAPQAGNSIRPTHTSSSVPLYSVSSGQEPVSTTPILPSTKPDAKQQLGSSWHLYKNERYGFSIEYPSDWIIETSENSEIEKVGPAQFLFSVTKLGSTQKSNNLSV